MPTDKYTPPKGPPPVEPKPTGEGEPVQPARHAESQEEAEKRQHEKEGKVPPPGSRDYVAGQPVSEEERAETEGEADRLAKYGDAQHKLTEDERKRREEEADRAAKHDNKGTHKK